VKNIISRQTDIVGTVFDERRMNYGRVATQLLHGSFCALNVIIAVRNIDKYYLLGYDTV
jgi:hypothetical protein